MALDQVEVLNDETPDPWMRIADFERQIADGAAKLEARFPEQSPIPVEHRAISRSSLLGKKRYRLPLFALASFRIWEIPVAV